MKREKPVDDSKDKCYYRVVQSQFGDINVVWKVSQSDIKIIQLVLPRTRCDIKRCLRVITESCPSFIDRICRGIEQFVGGKAVDFPLRHFDTSQLYSFQKRVLLFERRIPYGWVSTYRRLAKKMGTPGAARAIGNALSRNPFPLVIPCHRTIRSDGSLGGFSGGLQLKRQLLELEGIRFDKGGKVIMENLW